MSDWLQMLIAATAAIVGVCTVLGIVARRVLLPWIQQEIAHPAQAAAHAVTVNHHSSPNPTVLDKLDDLKEAVNAHLIEAAKDHERLAAAERDLGRHDDRLTRIENKRV